MPTFPIRTRSRSLHDWMRASPEQFERERSPRKTVTWGVIAGVGAVLLALALLLPGAVVEVLHGGRRPGLAVLAAYLVPAAMLVTGVVMQWFSFRYRVRGGGVVRSGELFVVAGGLDLRGALDVLARGTRDPQLEATIAWLEAQRVDPRVEVGNQMVAIASAPESRRLWVGLLRMDARRRGDLWIDAEPVEVAGDAWFDVVAMRAAAARAATNTRG